MSGTRAALLALALGGATIAVHTRAADRADALATDDDVAALAPSSVVRALSLGHHELAADLFFARAVDAFGARAGQPHDARDLGNLLDMTLALDPDFRAPYLFAARAALFHAGTPSGERARRPKRILEAALARFPDDWEIAFTLGCDYLFADPSSDPVRRQVERTLGGEHIRRAAIVGGGPPWLANLAATVLDESGEREAARRWLEEAYLTSTSDEERGEILRLLAVYRPLDASAVERERQRFDERWRRALPYAPADLFVILGDPPSPRLDLPFLVGE